MVRRIKALMFLSALMLVVFFLGCDEDEVPLRCALAPDVGPCDALIPKYYFDSSENRCKEFDWGGCDGVVPFDTMEECEECLASGG